MTSCARYRFVSTLECEFSRAVVESVDVLPLRRVVTGFAGNTRQMRIGVTNNAFLASKVILSRGR